MKKNPFVILTMYMIVKYVKNWHAKTWVSKEHQKQCFCLVLDKKKRDGNIELPLNWVSSLTVFLMAWTSRFPAFVTVEYVWDVGLLDFGAGQMHPYAALVALDHGSPCERFPTVASDQIPWVVTCRKERTSVKAVWSLQGSPSVSDRKWQNDHEKDFLSLNCVNEKCE